MRNAKTWLLVAAVVAGIWGVGASVAGEDAPAAALSPGDILVLPKNLQGTDAAVQSPRLAMLRQIEADYLSDTTATQRVPPPQWRDIVFLFVGDLSPDACSAWIAKLRFAFVYRPEAVSPDRAGDVAALVEALRRLGDADTAGLPRVFDEVWEARNEQAALSGADCGAIRASWVRLGEKSLAQKWAAREYEALVGTAAARSAIDLRGLAGLGRALSATGMTGKDKAYPEFAAALTRLAGEGKLPPVSSWEADRALASPLGTLETQQVLEAELTGPNGSPRLPVAKVLAWAHRQAETLGVWQALLDQKAAEAPAGDQKVLWLQARAYAEATGDTRTPPRVIRGKRWLEEALRTAESPDLRLEVLRLLASAYIDADQYDEGLVYLASVASQFPDEEVAALRDAIRQQKAAWIEHELAIVRRGAEQMEVRAAEAATMGKEELRKVCEHHARFYRGREKELLDMLKQ